MQYERSVIGVARFGLKSSGIGHSVIRFRNVRAVIASSGPYLRFKTREGQHDSSMSSHHHRSHAMSRIACGKYLLHEDAMPIVGSPPPRGDDIVKIVDRVVQDEASDSDSDVESEIHYTVYKIRMNKASVWEALFVVNDARCRVWEGVCVSNSRVIL